MAELATAYINLQPSFRGFKSAVEQELGGLESTGRREGEKVGKGFGDQFHAATGRSIEQAARSMTVGSAIMTAALGGTVKVAGSLNAAIAANNKILKDGAVTAQSWAKNSVESVGLSERAAIEAVNSFALFGEKAGLAGVELANFGTSITERTADMAAFIDVSPVQAIEDVRSALAGSSETLAKYGIDARESALKAQLLADTGVKVTGVMTNAQRTTALYGAIMAQTATISGQWARESDEITGRQAKLAAVVENTAASIGQDLLPAGEAALGWAADAVRGFGDLNEATGGAVVGIVAAATGITGAVGVSATAAVKISALARAFNALGRSAKIATMSTGAIGLVLTGAAVAWGSWTTKQETARRRAKDLTEALTTQTQSVLENAEAAAEGAGQFDGLAAANKALANALTGSHEEGDKLRRSLGILGYAADDAVVVLSELKQDRSSGFRAMAEQAGLSSQKVDILTKSLERQQYTSELRSLDKVVSDFGLTGDAARDAVSELQPFRDAMLEVSTASGRSSAVLAEAATETIALDLASGHLTKSAVEQAEAALGVSRASERSNEVLLMSMDIMGKMTQAERDAARSAEGLSIEKAAVADEAVAVAAAMPKTVRTVERAETAFERAAREAGYFSSALDGLVGSQVDVQAEQDRMLDTIAKLDEAIKGTSEATKRNGEALSQNTAKGRENRAAIRDTVEQTLRLGEAMLASGEDVNTTSQVMLAQRDTLIEQVMAFGLSEDAAKAYIDQLGLTPETIDTAITAHNKQALEAAQEALNRLEGIPDSVRSSIQAEINEGSYKNAQDRIAALIRARTIMLSFDGLPGGSMGGMGKQDGPSAYGNYFSEPGWTTIAEDGDHEVVLPLEKPVHLQRHLSNPNVLEPIMQALDSMGVASSGGGITINNNHAPFDLDRALAQAALLVS